MDIFEWAADSQAPSSPVAADHGGWTAAVTPRRGVGDRDEIQVHRTLEIQVSRLFFSSKSQLVSANDHNSPKMTMIFSTPKWNFPEYFMAPTESFRAGTVKYNTNDSKDFKIGYRLRGMPGRPLNQA